MDFSALNGFDYIVLFIVFLSVLFGLAKGFIRSFLSFIGWVLAGYISYISFPLVKPFLLNHSSNEMIVNVGGPVATYFVVLTIISLINYQLINLLGSFAGGMVDRSLGVAFGFVRGALVVTVAFIGLTIIAPGMEDDKVQKTYQQQTSLTKNLAPEWLQKAETYQLLRIGEAILVTSIPEDLINRTQQLVGGGKKSTSLQQPTFLQAIKVVEQMQALIPKDMQLGVNDVTISSATTEDSDRRQKEVFRIILEAYRTSLNAGRIPPAQALKEEDIHSLEAVIKMPYTSGIMVNNKKEDVGAKASNVGYDAKQIDALNQLIQTVQ